MRYFVFFYSFQTETKQGGGSVWLPMQDKFPSNREIKECAERTGGEIFKSSDTTVTGWEEMTAEDFYNFTEMKPDTE